MFLLIKEFETDAPEPEVIAAVLKVAGWSTTARGLLEAPSGAFPLPSSCMMLQTTTPEPRANLEIPRNPPPTPTTPPAP